MRTAPSIRNELWLVVDDDLGLPVVSRSEAGQAPNYKLALGRLRLYYYLMSFIFTPTSNRQAHMKHSPSLTLERGETRLRSPRPIRANERTSFYTNADTGIDFDGELKSGYRSGDIQSFSPILEASSQSFEPSITSSSTSRAVHLRRSSASPSPILQAFSGQPAFRSMSRSSSFNVERELEEREMLRKQRMRKAGGNVDCGTVTVLLAVMVICLTVMLLVYFKIR